MVSRETTARNSATTAADLHCYPNGLIVVYPESRKGQSVPNPKGRSVKTAQLVIPLTPGEKRLITDVAAAESRSRTSLLVWLVKQHAKSLGLEAAE